MEKKEEKKKDVCYSCNGKGWYSQFNKKIHKVACSSCNYRNKKKLKGVFGTVFDSMASM